MSQEHTTLTAEQQQWLADTMARNRALYGGYRMEAGADSDAGDSDADAKATDDTDADTETETDTDSDGQDDTDKSDDDKRVAKANREAQRYRTELRQLQTEQQATKDLLAKLTKALTGEDGDKDAPADPKALAAKVDELTNTVGEQAVHLKVYELAPAAGANAAALLDSRAFAASLKGLDPTQDAAKITKAIKDTVAANPAYRLTQGSARGGGDIDADKAEGTKGKQLSLTEAIAARLGK